MHKIVFVLLAEGFEEIEAVTPIDILRRAGLDVTVAGVGSKELMGTNGIRLTADILLDTWNGDLPDAVILPGGARGASNLSESAAVKALLNKMRDAGRLIAAICASPALVLERHGFLEGKKATCYPGYEKNFGPKTAFSEERVVSDGQILTSRGPGTSLEFSLELVRRLVDAKTAQTILQQTLAKA